MARKKNNKIRATIAVASVSTLLLSFSMQASILSAIQRSFTNEADAQIQLVYSICSLTALPSMFGFVKLSEIISKKKCVIIGNMVMVIGGILPIFLFSCLWMLYLSSALIGLGMGFINVGTATLISEYFKGAEKGKIMGIQSAIQGASAAVYSIIGAAIANWLEWRWSFAVFLLGIPALILFIVLMPEDRPCKLEKRGHTHFFTKQLFILIILSFIFNLMSTGFQSNISLFIDSEGMGSVVLSGILNAFFMIVGVPTGFMLGAYIKKLKRWANVVVAGLAVIGMIIIFISQGLTLVIIGTVLVGVAFASYAPINMTFVCCIAEEENVSRSVATSSAIACIARFTSPVAINFIMNFLGGGIRNSFIVCAVGLSIVFVLLILINPVKNSELV